MKILKEKSGGYKGQKYYKFKVDINPKVFMKYNIDKVPAVIFVKNYNPLIEISGVSYKELQSKKNIEDVYISYGDSDILYVLNKINKKAKSKGLKNFIKSVNKNFFGVKR